MEHAIRVTILETEQVLQYVEITKIYSDAEAGVIRLEGKKYQVSATLGDFDKDFKMVADQTTLVPIYSTATGEPVTVDNVGQTIPELDLWLALLMPLISPHVQQAVKRREGLISEPLRHYLP